MEWKISTTLIPYEESLALMEERVRHIHEGNADEMVWLLEHPPLYTAGTSATASDLIEARFPVHQTGRGGQYTYHGPGQRIAYVMLDLRKRGQDVRRYVQQLEVWIIETLATFGVKGEVREGRVGVWITHRNTGSIHGGVFGDDPAGEMLRKQHWGQRAPQNISSEAKIAAIGVRVRKWITYHGIALNVSPDLSHYAGIIPCGVREFGITSLASLGIRTTTEEVDKTLNQKFGIIFRACS